MTVSLPRLDLQQTSTGRRRLLMGLAVVRAAMAGGAVLAAPWLYREHAAVLVLLRPTKEVFLFAGFQLREGDVSLPVVIVAALPLLLAGVWLFFALGRAYAEDLEDAELRGLAGRILPKRRLDHLRRVLDDRGMRVVFLGRLAAFPSSLMAATAGAAGVPWKDFLIADTAGALVSLGVVLGVGYGLGEAYDEGGAWVTGGGVVALVALAIVVGRALSSGGSSRRS
jgi:membrane protein DedA with SNARE-associated domain